MPERGQQFGGRPTNTHPLREQPKGVYANDRSGTQGQMITGGQEQPWPQGFTPERQREVNDAVDSAGTTFKQPLNPLDVRRGVDRWTKVYSDHGRAVSGDYPPRMHAAEEGKGRARFVGDVARSTAPVEDLQGLDRVDVHPGETFKSGGIGNALGSYTSGDQHIQLASESDESTTIHELGHHVSHQRENYHDENHYKNIASRGREEAFADDYSAQHLPKHYTDKSGPSAYEQGYSAYGQTEDFQRHYRSARTTPLSGKQFPWTKEPSGTPEEEEPISGHSRQPSFDELLKHQSASEEGLLPKGPAEFLGDWKRFSGMRPHEQDEYLGAKRYVQGADNVPPMLGKQLESQTFSGWHKNNPRGD